MNDLDPSIDQTIDPPIDASPPDSRATKTRATKGRTTSRGQGYGEWLGIILAAVVAALVLRSYVVQTFYIPSASMEKTLLIHDRVLVNKLAYKVGTVSRGDIVVFKSPPAETDKNITDLIKRVIALPGDTIETHNGQVYINGKRIDEPYLVPGVPTLTLDPPIKDLAPLKIPAGQYWVMGDNRTNSADSRRFGPIDGSLLVGKAFVRVWPLSRLGGL